MPIHMQCMNCKKKLKAKDEMAGQMLDCPNCGEAMAVPGRQSFDEPTAPSTERTQPQEDDQGRRTKKKKKASDITPKAEAFNGSNMLKRVIVAFFAVCIISGLVFMAFKAWSIKQAQDRLDWSNDYSKFMQLIVDQEKSRLEEPWDGHGGAVANKPHWLEMTPPGKNNVGPLTGDAEAEWIKTHFFHRRVEWEGIFQGVGEVSLRKEFDGLTDLDPYRALVTEYKELKFDLPVRHGTERQVDRKNENNVFIKPGAEYEVKFLCPNANVAEWNAVPKGKMVRFSGLVGENYQRFPRSVRGSVMIQLVYIQLPGPELRRTYFVNINVLDVKLQTQ